MSRDILMQHHPRQGKQLVLAWMSAFARSLGHDARTLQMQLEIGVALAEAVVFDEMLVKMLDSEALVALAVKPLYLLS